MHILVYTEKKKHIILLAISLCRPWLVSHALWSKVWGLAQHTPWNHLGWKRPSRWSSTINTALPCPSLIHVSTQHIYIYLEHFQGQWFYPFLGQPVPVFDDQFCKEIFPKYPVYTSPDATWVHLLSVLSLVTREKRLTPACPQPSCPYFLKVKQAAENQRIEAANWSSGVLPGCFGSL